MDDVELKRSLIREVYSTDTWKDKVSKMPSHQVVAVYIRFKLAGKVS